MHHGPLIGILVAGLGLAFIFGTAAQRLKLPPLAGYLIAGIAVGPFTPGYVADQNLANELAEVGVILLMFGVGLHFSLSDLLSVRKLAIPGAVAQIATATLLGMGLAHLLGWTLIAGVIFGLALSVASTVVLLRALQERRLVQSERGRIAVGWLIVEDLAMVLALVLIPAIGDAFNGGTAGHGPLATRFGLGLPGVLALTFLKVAGFVAFMLVIGRRIIPWILHEVAHTGSRELFRLAVLSLALGVAFGAAALFGVSFALGAFFGGMILSESRLSQRAAEETIPLRDAFAVLFFVSVGMLFNPAVVIEAPLAFVATLLIVMVGKSLAAYGIVLAFGHPRRTALTISASLAQIGEFSFILVGLGVGLGLMPAEGRDLVLAGAIVSILLNPAAFWLVDRIVERDAASRPVLPAPEPDPLAPTTLDDHTIIVGYGRVGGYLGAGLRESGETFLVIEDDEEAAKQAAADGAEVLSGNAADPRVLEAANLAGARRLFVAIPEAFEAGQVVHQARKANSGLEIVARAHSDDEVRHLTDCGATLTIMGEREIALEMLRFARVEPPGPAVFATPSPEEEEEENRGNTG